MNKHGQFGTRLYNTWSHMKQRCYNPKNSSYEHYGLKGIKVCEEWQQFEPFYKWSIANGYNDTLTIDRIDNDKNYSPDNCRWATIEQQNNNKTDTRLITYRDKTQSIAKWAKEYNIKYTTLVRRLEKCKMPIDKALEYSRIHKVKYQGETHTLKEWADITGISYYNLKHRIFRAGWSIERALTTL